jgi:phosphoglycolate phosphatase
MKLALFDVDGTLVDSKAMITASLTAAFAAEALPLPERTRLLSIVGLSLVDAMRALAPQEEAAVHMRLAEAYKQAFWQFRTANAHEEALFTGARGILQKLRENDDIVLGLATGKSRRGIDHLIDKHGFEGWFQTIQTSDHHPSKPHPSMVHQALDETGVPPERAIMIGDTSFDIEMALAGGIGAIGVAWGNHPQAELERAGAHHVAQDFAGLEAALAALWKNRAP